MLDPSAELVRSLSAAAAARHVAAVDIGHVDGVAIWWWRMRRVCGRESASRRSQRITTLTVERSAL